VLKKPTDNFDLLFVGLGASNCLLILRLHENEMLNNKTIAVIEPNSKSINDKTFCFWATEEELFRLKLNKLVSKSWDCLEIGGIVKQEINPLKYYYVKSIDLYNTTKNVLNNYQFSLYDSHLIENPKIINNAFEVSLMDEVLFADKVFDSRPPNYQLPKKHQSHLFQSFYGWKIKTVNHFFDIDSIMMMDFRIEQNNATQFIYILPFEHDYALVEVTRFGNCIIKEEEALPIFYNYVNKLGITFEIIETERGVLPMTSSQMQIENFGKNWINMGAKANLLKATTGYAFLSMAEDAIALAENEKNNYFFKSRNTKKQRFGYYDRLLLKILNDKPEYGKPIFETLFQKVPIVNVLSFMGEKTNLLQEFSIFFKLPKKVFILTAIRDIYQQIKTLPVLILPFLFTIFFLILNYLKLESISWLLLGIGFFTVGLSHGALDHITQKVNLNVKEYTSFIVKYLIKSALIGLVWLAFPSLALIIFIAYSAWHFGQADYNEWNLKHGMQSFLWGLTALLLILLFHINELNLFLLQIPNLQVATSINHISHNQLFMYQIGIVILGFILALLNKSKFIALTLIYLLLTSMLPLLLSFGIYFVCHHSMHGWKHLKHGLNDTVPNLLLKALPFTLGGIIIILFFMLFFSVNYIGIFFIVLSCLSMPHVLSMNYFYTKSGILSK
jgi:lycopene beta-cyclase